MSWIMYVLIVPSAALGMLVNSLGVISLDRFKDVYMRMHGATKCSTLGAIFCAAAVIVYCVARIVAGGELRFAVLIIHIVMALFGLLIGNSTSAHVLSRAAYRSGLKPRFAVVDEFDGFCKKELLEEEAAELAQEKERE